MRHTVETSGAYLFLPDGDASEIRIENTLVKIVEGPIYSAVIVQLPFVQHTVTLYNTPGKKKTITITFLWYLHFCFTGADGLGLEIENLVDISTTQNFELAMRLSTNINSTDEFFTDLNGFQVFLQQTKHIPTSQIFAFFNCRFCVENALKSSHYKPIITPCLQQHTSRIKPRV